jgi:hypothetical protein
MSAEAVAAVRRGLRVAFSRASCPVLPASRGMGAPTTRMNGRASIGLNAIAPITTA